MKVSLSYSSHYLTNIFIFCTGVYDSISGGVDRIKYWRGTESTTEKEYERDGQKRPGRQHQLPPFYQFIMCLIRLRLNLPLLLLADLFDVSCSSVTRVTITWVSYMHQTLVPALLIWPSQASIRGWIPFDFKVSYPNTRVVIDCAEFFIDRPKNKDEQYKHIHNTKATTHTQFCLAFHHLVLSHLSAICGQEMCRTNI
jgi:hypothetical protein